MDRNNLQINQMNASGNEFALRVALCDLVQRLKRSEFMCKYLEQCRNELANEVIKLRSHNNLLLKEIIDNPQKNVTFNQQQNPQNSSNVLELENQSEQRDDYKKSVKLDSIVDESWEEITNRLINQLKKEILTADTDDQNQLNVNDEIQEKKSTLCSSGSNYFDLKSDQNAENLMEVNEANEYETQEQHIAINDLNDIKIEDISKEKESDQDKMKLTYKLLEDYSLINNNSNNNLKVIEVHEHKDQQKSNIHELFKEYFKQHSNQSTKQQPNQMELVEKILHNYNLDLEEITRQIMVQNDKLIKLKGKQIRNYFRRQLDINKTEPNTELKIKE